MTWRAKASLIGATMTLAAVLACTGSGRSRPAETRPASPVVPATAGESLDAGLPLDPAVSLGRLDNGLAYYVRKNSKPENRAELWLAVDVGSMQEDDDQQGLAHFVEHMAFNGTRHFAKHELVDYLESIGMQFGPDLNAYTSFDETVYTLTVPTEDPEIQERALLILEDWAHAMAFEDEEIEKERGVVLEEWRLGRGAGARIRDKQLPLLFKDSRYAERLPIGKEEVLREAPHEALRRFYREWYRPDLMAVIAVGDFDPEAVERSIRSHFSDLPVPEARRERRLYPVPDHEETLVSVETDPEQTSTQVSVYYKLDKRTLATESDYRRTLVEELHHSMLNSRLDELRQQADPPFLGAFSYSGDLVRTRDVYGQGAQVEDNGLSRGLEALLIEVERVDRHGFVQSELDRAKKALLRGMEQAYRERDKQRSDALAGEMVRHFLQDEPMPGIELEWEMTQRLLGGIGLDEVNHLAREWIGERNRVILASGPEKEGVDLAGPDELLTTFEATQRAEVEPWVDRVRDEPLVAEAPSPGQIVERRQIAELDVTEWRLSNGALVVLKPTNFKNDQVLLEGASPGGHSLAPDAIFDSAASAAAVADVGGLGTFDSVELEKALAGQVVSASAFIGELEEGINAGASPEDLETMFELIYLVFTAPRKDAEAFQSWRTRREAQVENRLARPETVFGDKMSVVMSQDHLRRRPPSKEALHRIDLDRALEVYRDRFSDAGDFIFVIVGNFEPEAIESQVRTYLGGLPARGRRETWKDVGVSPPSGVEKFVVHKGLEPKSRVTLTFNGDAEWSRQASHDVESLADVLRIRLREVLREEMGATYGVGVFGGISRRPRERFSFTISFGCAPASVDEMTAAVFGEIESLKQTPVGADYVTKVQESQTRERETDLEENGFWRSVLLDHYRYGMDPRLILAYDELVQSVTAERLQTAARRYLDTGRYVMGVLYPEPASPPAASDQ